MKAFYKCMQMILKLLFMFDSVLVVVPYVIACFMLIELYIAH